MLRLSPPVSQLHKLFSKYFVNLTTWVPPQEWKNGGQNLGNVPPYSPELNDAQEEMAPPDLLLCTMGTSAEGKPVLSIPASIRSKWSDDAARKDEWHSELVAFDSRLADIHAVGFGSIGFFVEV